MQISELQDRYQKTSREFCQFREKYHRPDTDVRLIAVSKRHPAQSVVEVARLGQTEFAENYVQEGVDKIQVVRETAADIADKLVWHFIGHIQSKKSKLIAQNFDWVHTVESIKVAQKLNQHRESDTPLNVLIQLNLQDEETKSGIGKNALAPLADAIRGFENLRLRGLMIIPKSESDFHKQRDVFRECRTLLDELNQTGMALDELSMGMTNDMEAAIAEGSTQVRIGTAIFGKDLIKDEIYSPFLRP